MERDSKRFKVYNSKNGKMVYCVPEKSGSSGGAVISADHLDGRNYVATTANNNSINFWDENNYIFRERICTSEIQMTVKWSKQYQRLFSGGCDSVIHAYNIDNMKEVGGTEGWNPLHKDSNVGHKGPIMDLLPIED